MDTAATKIIGHKYRSIKSSNVTIIREYLPGNYWVGFDDDLIKNHQQISLKNVIEEYSKLIGLGTFKYYGYFHRSVIYEEYIEEEIILI